MRPPLWPLLAAALLVAASPLRAQEDAAARWASHTEDGRSALASGALGRAELAMRDALAAALDLAAEDPRRAAALNNVGFVLHARGELKEAAIFYRQALELRERWLGAGDPAVARASSTWPSCAASRAVRRRPGRTICGRWRSARKTRAMRRGWL